MNIALLPGFMDIIFITCILYMPWVNLSLKHWTKVCPTANVQLILGSFHLSVISHLLIAEMIGAVSGENNFALSQ